MSEEVRSRRADIDWRRIAGFRNILVHDYLGVDIRYVWSIIRQELPALKAAVQALLDEIGAET